MLSLRITNSARFLQMPLTAHALYFHLALHADDDGVVESFPIIKITGAAQDDLKILLVKFSSNSLQTTLLFSSLIGVSIISYEQIGKQTACIKIYFCKLYQKQTLYSQNHDPTSKIIAEEFLTVRGLSTDSIG